METNSNDGTAIADPSMNIDSAEKMNTDEEFYDDSAPVSDFDNAENDENFEQRFQANNRGGFR